MRVIDRVFGAGVYRLWKVPRNRCGCGSLLDWLSVLYY